MSTTAARLTALLPKSELKDLLSFLTPQEIAELEAIAESLNEEDRTSVLEQSKEVPLLQWLAENFPTYITKPFAERHLRLWKHIESITPGVKPPPLVEVWPRGSAKSTTAELGCARIGYKKSRQFVLYVSETQEQADKHVATISSLFEKLGMERALNKYGNSKGWRRNQLRVENGFSLESIGLDTAARGVKIDENRPGLMIFDDIDNHRDSPKTVEKKLETIKASILPAGSSDCGIIFLQNLIHEDGVVAQLYDDRADFLLDRIVPPLSVAVEGLKVDKVKSTAGRNVYKIVGGKATWEGQDLAVCEAQINEYGLKTFLREAQHEVHAADGTFFLHNEFNIIDELPKNQGYSWAIGFDLAATEGGGDYTAYVELAIGADGNTYIVDVFNEQIGPEKVQKLIDTRVPAFKQAHPNGQVRIPQDPGQAGKAQAFDFRSRLKRYDNPPQTIKLLPVSGSKAVNAGAFAAEVNLGNVYLLKADWNHYYILQHRRFREDEDHEHDDIIDAESAAFNSIHRRKRAVARSYQG